MCSARPDTGAQLAVSATSAMFLCIFQKMGVKEGEHRDHYYLGLLTWLRSYDPSCLGNNCVCVCCRDGGGV